VRLGWADSADGWKWESEDPRLWEVFCAECGDRDGPADIQEPAVRELRGPYRSEHHARHVATAHFNGN
jgi:hypothetical protein